MRCSEVRSPRGTREFLSLRSRRSVVLPPRKLVPPGSLGAEEEVPWLTSVCLCLLALVRRRCLPVEACPRRCLGVVPPQGTRRFLSLWFRHSQVVLPPRKWELGCPLGNQSLLVEAGSVPRGLRRAPLVQGSRTKGESSPDALFGEHSVRTRWANRLPFLGVLSAKLLHPLRTAVVPRGPRQAFPPKGAGSLRGEELRTTECLPGVPASELLARTCQMNRLGKLLVADLDGSLGAEGE